MYEQQRDAAKVPGYDGKGRSTKTFEQLELAPTLSNATKQRLTPRKLLESKPAQSKPRAAQ